MIVLPVQGFLRPGTAFASVARVRGPRSASAAPLLRSRVGATGFVIRTVPVTEELSFGNAAAAAAAATFFVMSRRTSRAATAPVLVSGIVVVGSRLHVTAVAVGTSTTRSRGTDTFRTSMTAFLFRFLGGLGRLLFGGFTRPFHHFHVNMGG